VATTAARVLFPASDGSLRPERPFKGAASPLDLHGVAQLVAGRRQTASRPVTLAGELVAVLAAGVFCRYTLAVSHRDSSSLGQPDVKNGRCDPLRHRPPLDAVARNASIYRGRKM
jgi:hypothetical protein